MALIQSLKSTRLILKNWRTELQTRCVFTVGPLIYQGKYYWWYKFQRTKELCQFMSRLGSLGAEEIYEVMQDLCSN